MDARPYQHDFHTGCMAALETHTSALGILPTGMGKTFCASRLAGAERWDRHVLFLAHRVELLEQTQRTFERVTGNRAYIEQAERTIPPMYTGNGSLLIASVATLNANRLRKPVFDPERYSLIITDEAHHATAKSYLNIYAHFGIGRWEEERGRRKFKINEDSRIKHLGLTATPNRHDGQAMGLVFQTVGFKYEIWDAVQQGWLVEPVQKIVKVEGLDMASIDKHGKDFTDADLERLMIEEGPLHKLADSAMQECGERQGIIFTSGVAHAHLVAEVINRRRQGAAVAIDGTTHPEVRESAFSRFRKGQTQFLCNYGIATEGFDHPETAAIVMGRPTKSLSLYVQMLGRGLRTWPGLIDGIDAVQDRRAAIAGSRKPDCLVLDYVGNSRHKLVTCIDVLGGQYSAEVLKRAEEKAATAGGGNAHDHIEEAKAELVSEIVRKVRHQFAPKALYQTQEVSPFERKVAAPVQQSVGTFRGGATDKQVALLVKLGVPEAVALRYHKRQAGAVITELKAKRCTTAQAAVLKRHGMDPSLFNFDSASKRIDGIMKARRAFA